MQLKEPGKFEAEVLTTINIKGSHELMCEFGDWCYKNKVIPRGGGFGPFWAYGSYTFGDAKKILQWLKDRKCEILGEHDDNKRLD